MKPGAWLRTLGIPLQLGLGALSLYWIITWSNVNGGQLMQRLSEISFWPIILAILCFAGAMGLMALRYYIFLPPPISIFYLIGLTLFQNMLLTFMPWRLGELGYPWFLRRDYNIPVANSVGVILAIRLVDLLVISAVAIVGGRQLDLGVSKVGIILGMGILVAVLIITLSGRWPNQTPALFPMALSAIEPLRRPRWLAGFIGLSMAIFMLTTMQSMLILQAMALTITFPHVALLNASTLLVALLPIHPPGGWGTIDSVQVLLLERLGYNPKISTASILAAHSFYFLLIFLGGMVGWLLPRKSYPTRKAGATS